MSLSTGLSRYPSNTVLGTPFQFLPHLPSPVMHALAVVVQDEVLRLSRSNAASFNDCIGVKTMKGPH